MGDGVYFGVFPTESIALRVVLASVVAVLLARLLLRAGVRVPRVRAAAALVPSATLVLIVATCWSNPHLPTLLLPDTSGMPVQVNDTIYWFAPRAGAILLGVWAVIAGARIIRRMTRLARSRRELRSAFTLRSAAPTRVRRTVDALSERAGIPTPAVAVIEDCPGGATLAGISQPMLLLDRDLVAKLDDQELEGVIAHELAHAHRRDNLASLVLSLARDVFFFVPGGGWALKRLHAEREFAADQEAVGMTSRPGALASGLLKVMDARAEVAGCSALVSHVPESSLVARVKALVEPREISRTRVVTEFVVLAVAVSASVSAGMVVPSWIVGDGIGNRAALALMWNTAQTAQTSDAIEVGESRALEVFRSAPFGESTPTTASPSSPAFDDGPREISAAVLAACADISPASQRLCRSRSSMPSLPLRPPPTRSIDDRFQGEWGGATPIVENTQGLSLWWLHSVSVAS